MKTLITDSYKLEPWKMKEVIVVKDGEWDTVRKAPNEAGSPIIMVSMANGKDGADYEIIYKDKTYKLFKFA